MRLFLLPLLLFCTTLYAELFKWTDENGNVIYSDQPPPSSHNQQDYQVNESELPPLINTPGLSLPAISNRNNDGGESNDIQSINIVFPEHDTAVRSNGGQLTIEVAVQPELKRGETVVIMMDQQEVFRGPALSVSLVDVDRGTHVIEAMLVARGGQTLSTSDPVSFTLQRFSANF